MSIVLIDARAYGQQLRRARKSLHMNKATVAEILKISPRDLYLYEIGRLPIPPDVCVVASWIGVDRRQNT